MAGSYKGPDPNATGSARFEARRQSASKVCSKCGEKKTLDNFHRLYRDLFEEIDGVIHRIKATDPRKYTSACKYCTYQPAANNEDFGADRKTKWTMSGRRTGNPVPAAERKRQQRDRTRIQSLLYLAEQGCENCGERDPRLLEFDHRDPAKKKHNVSTLLRNLAWSNKTLQAEIRKCRVLCVSCHRLHTIKQMDYYGRSAVQDTLKEIYARFDIDE